MHHRSLILLILALCLLALSPSLAQEPVIPVFEIIQNGLPVGTGVLFYNDTFLITTAPLQNDHDILIRTGDEQIVPAEVYTDADGLFTLLVSGQAMPGTPLSLETVTSGGLTYTGYDAQGNMLTGPCTRTAYAHSPEGLILSAAPGLLPGAVLTGPTGGIAGLTAASLSEGCGRYYAITSDDIYARILPASDEAAESFLKVEAEAEHNRVHLSWEAPESGAAGFCVFRLDTLNGYYTYNLVEDTSATFSCVPGRTYSFYVRALESMEQDPTPLQFPQDMGATLTVPMQESVNAYGFTDKQVYLSSWAGKEDPEDFSTVLEPLEDFSTVFHHGENRIFLQVISTYEVTETIQADLTVALYAPDDTCYSMLSGYVFAPEYMPEDAWHMDITEVFDACSSYGGITEGTYRLRYFIDEAMASEISFTVPASSAAAEMPRKTSVIHPSFTLEHNRVNLHWEADRDGRNLYCVYFQDILNPYFSYTVVSEPSEILACVPGRTYTVHVLAIDSEDDIPPMPVDEDPVTFTVPMQETFEDYGFRNTAVHLSDVQPDHPDDMTVIFPPMEDTSDIFSSETPVYLQVVSTYEVTEEIQKDLTVALYAPDGACYSTVSGYLFAPEYMQEDAWHMDISELFASCRKFGSDISGTYTLSWFLDDALSSSFTFSVGEEELSRTETDPLGFLIPKAEVIRNRVRLTWGMPLSGENTFCVYMQDTLNHSFYSWVLTQETSVTLPCVPGRTYTFHVRALESQDEDTALDVFPPEMGTVVTIPLQEKITEYGFRDLNVYLSHHPGGEPEDPAQILEPMKNMSSIFSLEDIYLQVISTYEVTEEIRSDLTVALYAPDGTCFFMVSGYIFAPEYMPEDAWHMDITELFASCREFGSSGLGTYRIRYFIDEKMASEFSFTVSEPTLLQTDTQM